MANGTRTLTLLVVFVVGIVAGWLVGHTKPGPTAPPPPPRVTVPPPPPTPIPPPACTPATPPTAKAKNWKLKIGPDPCQVAEEDGQPAPFAVISVESMHKIEFKSNAGQNLGIVIHVPQGWVPPFKKFAYVGNDPQGLEKWALSCDDPTRWCSTGPADKKAIYGCYKYDQILDGKTCDAGIIIEK